MFLRFYRATTEKAGKPLTETSLATPPSSFFLASALCSVLSCGYTIRGQLTKYDDMTVHFDTAGLVCMCMAIASCMCAHAIA